MSQPEDDHSLGCAAVGLWYRIRSAEKSGDVGEHEILTMAGDPTAWHPDGDLEDLEEPMDQLLSNGWVRAEQGRYSTVNDF